MSTTELKKEEGTYKTQSNPGIYQATLHFVSWQVIIEFTCKP